MEKEGKERILLVGDGWGAKSAYHGLKKVFSEIFVLSNDSSLTKLIKPNYITKSFNDTKFDIIICAGYKEIIGKEIINNYQIINIHYSLLPAYRGLHSVVWAILNNEAKLGLSIHIMNEFIDDGPILHQYSIDNDFKSTSYEIMTHFNEYIVNNLGKIIVKYLKKEIVAIEQDKSKASWVGKRGLIDTKIDFNKSIDDLIVFFRAIVLPYPEPFFVCNGKEYIVKDIDFHNSSVKTHNSRILNIDNEGVWVKCNDGYIILKEIVCRENNNNVTFGDFKIGKYLNK